jgi:hypothetical protein
VPLLPVFVRGGVRCVLNTEASSMSGVEIVNNIEYLYVIKATNSN